MHFSTVAILAAVVGTASAHFQLQYPPPRGVFVEDDEPTFCDGYDTSVSNRTVFPLSGGKFSLNSEHPKWTFGVILSTASNPSNFANFTQAVPFFQVTGEGSFCFPVDLLSSGISGVQDGANVTVQFVFDGGDGELFQCADLTLSSSATVPSSISCTNATGDTVQSLSGSQASFTVASTGSSSASSASTTASAPAQTSSSAASATNIMGATGIFAVFGTILSFL